MTRSRFINEYFEWMCDKVYDKKYCKGKNYRQLLMYLNKREFEYILEMDGNRAEDGVSLRYRFAYERNYNYSMVSSYLDDEPCSVLEMMVALATRCEEDLMNDPEHDTSIGKWFWIMIINLGLYPVTDEKFDLDYVNQKINIFLDRKYRPNGEGGLFTVRNARRDLRDVEIWYQMNWYLDELLNC